MFLNITGGIALFPTAVSRFARSCSTHPSQRCVAHVIKVQSRLHSSSMPGSARLVCMSWMLMPVVDHQIHHALAELELILVGLVVTALTNNSNGLA